MLPRLLSGRIAATFAQDGDLIQAGHIYVAPPDRHMILGPSHIALSDGPKVHHTRPAADPLSSPPLKFMGRESWGSFSVAVTATAPPD
jgi:chemotaxis response regulator CheB